MHGAQTLSPLGFECDNFMFSHEFPLTRYLEVNKLRRHVAGIDRDPR